MEKISGIIPSSRRTRAVDVSNSQPVRPGAPTWGRPVGKVTSQASSEIFEKVNFSDSDSLIKPKTENQLTNSTYNSRGQLAKSEVVEELSKKFFEPGIKELARSDEKTLSEQMSGEVDEKNKDQTP